MSYRISDRDHQILRNRRREFVGKFNSFKTFVRRSPLPFENAHQMISHLTRLLVRSFTNPARSAF